MNGRVWYIGVSLVLLSQSLLAAKYKVRTLQVKPAQEYEANSGPQSLTIAAWPADTLQKSLLLFDTKKVHEKNLVPILVVLENSNPFPVRLFGSDVLLILPDGTNVPPVRYTDAFNLAADKKSTSPGQGGANIVKLRNKNKEMYSDFEHKDFGEKIIVPADSDYGVVFYWMPEGINISGTRLYLPKIENMSTGEGLMFVEFSLTPE